MTQSVRREPNAIDHHSVYIHYMKKAGGISVVEMRASEITAKILAKAATDEEYDFMSAYFLAAGIRGDMERPAATRASQLMQVMKKGTNA